MQREKPLLLYSELTEQILGVYYDVYNEIGHGFLESVYANCMSYRSDRGPPRRAEGIANSGMVSRRNK